MEIIELKKREPIDYTSQVKNQLEDKKRLMEDLFQITEGLKEKIITSAGLEHLDFEPEEFSLETFIDIPLYVLHNMERVLLYCEKAEQGDTQYWIQFFSDPVYEEEKGSGFAILGILGKIEDGLYYRFEEGHWEDVTDEVYEEMEEYGINDFNARRTEKIEAMKKFISELSERKMAAVQNRALLAVKALVCILDEKESVSDEEFETFVKENKEILHLYGSSTDIQRVNAHLDLEWVEFVHEDGTCKTRQCITFPQFEGPMVFYEDGAFHLIATYDIGYSQVPEDFLTIFDYRIVGSTTEEKEMLGTIYWILQSGANGIMNSYLEKGEGYDHFIRIEVYSLHSLEVRDMDDDPEVPMSFRTDPTISNAVYIPYGELEYTEEEDENEEKCYEAICDYIYEE